LTLANLASWSVPGSWMKCVVVLKAVEEVTLQQMDTRTRAAGLLMLGRGLKARAIAAQLGVSGQSVYNWSVRHEVACGSCSHFMEGTTSVTW
jgi:DNA-directed RNA polymerase specialized sigma24 family protein